MYNLCEHHLGTNELIKCVTYASFSIRPAHWTLRPQDLETCCPYASHCQFWRIRVPPFS